MVRGRKLSSKRKFKREVRSNDKGSDDSDEDYVVSDEENEVSDFSDEDYRSSVDGHASEESFGSFMEGEEEDEEEEGAAKRVKKVGRSKPKKRSRKFIVEEEEDEEEQEEEEEEEEDEDGDKDEDEEMNEITTKTRSKVQRGLSRLQKNGVKPSQKRGGVTYKEDEDDDDDEEFTPNNDEDEDDDDEFTPDDDDCSDEEESRAKRKKNNAKAGKRVLQKKVVRGRKRRRKSVASKKSLRKKVKRTRGLRRRVRSDDDDDDGDFVGLVLREKVEMKRGRKSRRYDVPSDSDFVSSGSSEYEYTISEEEREQVREAKEYCRRLKINLRSSSMTNKIQQVVVLPPERKPMGRKGKEKVEEVKAEIIKQVCGICLSEEDKRKVRGTLNCCTHYFCFPCIMEWAKVESRCPLCKQRFNTISKPARNTAGIDLREVVVQVPERDQVWLSSNLLSFFSLTVSLFCVVVLAFSSKMCFKMSLLVCAGISTI